MVKLGIGGRALYVFVRAVSDLPNIEPDVKDTVKKKKKNECPNIIFCIFSVLFSYGSSKGTMCTL